MPMKLIDKHSQMDPRSAWLRQFDETDRILAARTRPALDHCRFRLWCWKQALGAPAETRAPLMIAAASSLRRSIAE